MLTRTIASADDGHLRHGGGATAGPALKVPQHDDVGVPSDDPDRVLQGLAFGGRGKLLGGFRRDDVAPESAHGRFEAETRARARLVEQGRHDATVENVGTVMLDDLLHLARNAEDVGHAVAVELLGLDDVTQVGHLRGR